MLRQRKRYYIKCALIGAVFGIIVELPTLMLLTIWQRWPEFLAETVETVFAWWMVLSLFASTVPLFLLDLSDLGSRLETLCIFFTTVILTIAYFTGLSILYGRIMLSHRKRILIAIITVLVILAHWGVGLPYTNMLPTIARAFLAP